MKLARVNYFFHLFDPCVPSIFVVEIINATRTAMPKLVSLETMMQSVNIPLSTNLPSSTRSAVAVTRRIKTKQQCNLLSDETNRLFNGGCHMKHINKPPMLYRAGILRGVECFLVCRKWKEENSSTPHSLTYLTQEQSTTLACSTFQLQSTLTC